MDGDDASVGFETATNSNLLAIFVKLGNSPSGGLGLSTVAGNDAAYLRILRGCAYLSDLPECICQTHGPCQEKGLPDLDAATTLDRVVVKCWC